MDFFSQMVLVWLDLLLPLLLFAPHHAYGIFDRSKLEKRPKCVYLFVTESAACTSHSMAEIEQVTIGHYSFAAIDTNFFPLLIAKGISAGMEAYNRAEFDGLIFTRR